MRPIRLKRHDNLIILVIILVASASVGVTGLAYWFFNLRPIYGVQEFYMDIRVENEIGFHVGADAIHFGYVPPDGAGRKVMFVTAGEFRTLVSIETTGNISGFVRVSDNDFILEPHQKTAVEVFAVIPEDAKTHTFYDGTLRVVLRKV
jgi:hypothetical protein